MANKDWTKNLFKQILIEKEELLWTEWEMGIVAACDGGLKDGKGSFGGVRSINSRTIIQYGNSIPETYNELTSYRCELVGILSIMMMYKKVREFVHCHIGRTISKKIKFLCDNKAAVETVNRMTRYKKFFPNQYCNPDSDILAEIQQQMHGFKQQSIQIKLEHIKGH
jgi:hypothetical protein